MRVQCNTCTGTVPVILFRSVLPANLLTGIFICPMSVLLHRSDWIIIGCYDKLSSNTEWFFTIVLTAELLRQESNRQAQLALTAQPSLSRKKVLRRRRISDRCVAKRPSVTDAPHVALSKHSTPVKHAQSLKGNVSLELVCCVTVFVMNKYHSFLIQSHVRNWIRALNMQVYFEGSSTYLALPERNP